MSDSSIGASVSSSNETFKESRIHSQNNGLKEGFLVAEVIIKGDLASLRPGRDFIYGRRRKAFFQEHFRSCIQQPIG